MSTLPRKLLRWSPVLFFGVALAVFLVLFFRFQRKPEILSLDRLMAGSGDRLEITGRYFGGGDDGSKLYVGSHALTSTGILEWEDKRILIRVPRTDGAALIRVKTRSGTSNGVILGDAARFPDVDYGPWLPGAPYVEYADPPAAAPGTPVILAGSGFGSRRGGGEIWVNRSDSSTFPGTVAPDLSDYIRVTAVDGWSSDTLRFWMPEGAVGGNVYISKGGFFSNPVSVELGDVPGTVEEGMSLQWSLRQEVYLDSVGAFPGNSVYLHIPVPHPGVGQDAAVVLEGPGEQSPQPMRNGVNLTLYRLDGLEGGVRRGVSRQLVVTTRPVRAEIDIDGQVPYDPQNPDIAGSLGTDEWIRPETVARVAAREIGRLRDDWSKSRALYDYVIALLDWNAEPPTRSIPDYIGTGEADSEGYAFLFCSLARAADVPARPVGGLVVLEDGSSRAWWWAEIWIEGLGWIPVDPALGDSDTGIVLPGSADDADRIDYYFGGLEGRHIAFSRGILDAPSLQNRPELRRPAQSYTLQGAWEEVSGNLVSYRSSWPVPRVTAVYGGS